MPDLSESPFDLRAVKFDSADEETSGQSREHATSTQKVVVRTISCLPDEAGNCTEMRKGKGMRDVLCAF
ncbi:hypothetical protein MRX96_047731 [Rhipicephalus microplus]